MGIIDKGFPWGIVMGIIVTGILNLIRGLLRNRHEISLEKVKIHDKDKLEAYKRLNAFTQKLGNNCAPTADNRELNFLSIIEKHYKGKLELDKFYFDPSIKKILKQFDDIYGEMTFSDSGPGTENVKAFFEDGLFTLNSELGKLVEKHRTV